MNEPKETYEHRRIVVIDDVLSMRLLLEQLLRDIGFRHIALCEDGGDALNELETAVDPVDLVICDLEMPLVDGFEFLHLLRGHRRADIKDTPVIVVTGHSEQKNLSQAVKAGIHGFLVKPVSHKALEKRVRVALKGAPIDPKSFGKNHEPQPDEIELFKF